MTLSHDTIQRLDALVRETTALVFIGDEPAGTAFFISEDLLLTCGHVAREDTVTIQPHGRKSRPAQVVRRPKTDLDLALLRSTPDNGGPSPCVVLGDAVDSYDCLIAGYPDLDGFAPGCEVRPGRMHRRTEITTGGDQYQIIDPGQIITYGMSGGPVVSAESGTVIAVVRTSKDAQGALGGGAIPVSLAAEAFSEEVREVLDGETSGMRRWRDALGRDNWRQLGRSWTIAERMDLWVTGDRTHWKVRLNYGGGRPFAHRGPRLGTGVAKAIFHWAQRRHMRGPDEVQLLGQLLARALFPNPLPGKLAALRDAGGVLICLHVPPGNDLADIPWELAADPFSDKQDAYLAAEQRFRFIRILARSGEPVSPPVPKPPSSIKVLTVVTEPPDPLDKDAPVPGNRRWPPVSAMRASLLRSIERSELIVTSVEHPSPSHVLDALDTDHYDVLHYMGIGRRYQGQAQILFVDDSDPERKLELWPDTHSILDVAASAGVRLVVLELMLPPEDKDLQQLTCSGFSDAVTGTVMAVVLTNLPVHPDQCQMFNDEFYRFLGGGASIGRSVQEARHTLKVSDPTGDAAGFGWFTVVTGNQSGIHLVAPPSRDPNVSGARGFDELLTEWSGNVRYR